MVTVVRRLGTLTSASTWSSHSPSATRSWRLKRVGVGLRVAPRPSLDSTGIQPFYASRENITRTLFRARTGFCDEPSLSAGRQNASIELSFFVHLRASVGLPTAVANRGSL